MSAAVEQGPETGCWIVKLSLSFLLYLHYDNIDPLEPCIPYDQHISISSYASAAWSL
jgi:hypothetical protein